MEISPSTHKVFEDTSGKQKPQYSLPRTHATSKLRFSARLGRKAGEMELALVWASGASLRFTQAAKG